MFTILVAVVIGLFVAMLFLQFYFRMKVLKDYRVLVQQRVQFGAMDLFDREKRDAVKVRYPQAAARIESFAGNLRHAVRMATVLLVLITAFGAILMYYR